MQRGLAVLPVQSGRPAPPPARSLAEAFFCTVVSRVATKRVAQLGNHPVTEVGFGMRRHAYLQSAGYDLCRDAETQGLCHGPGPLTRGVDFATNALEIGIPREKLCGEFHEPTRDHAAVVPH